MKGDYSTSDNLMSFEFGVCFNDTVLQFNYVSTTELTAGFSLEDNLKINTSLKIDTIYVSGACPTVEGQIYSPLKSV